jgi:hypothetical protein
MKAPRKFSAAIRVIGWIFTVWLGSTAALLGVGSVLDWSETSPELLVAACVCLGAAGCFAWLATARQG